MAVDNGTFEKNREVEYEQNRILEEYRFTFLHYLDVAEKVLNLRNKIGHVKNMRRIMKYGKNDPRSGSRAFQKQEAIRTGRVLHCQYGMEYTNDGFNSSVGMFYADLGVTKKQEEFLWHLVQETVSAVWSPEHGESKWFYEKPGRNHALMVNDKNLSPIRIQYYKASLGRLEHKPSLPAQLEQEFSVYYAGLTHLAPL